MVQATDRGAGDRGEGASMRAADVSAERATIDAQVKGQTLCTVLERNARVHGARPALSWKQDGIWKTLTWLEYRDRVAEAAMGLEALGVGRGDFVAVMARNRPEHLIADLAAVHIGATPVSLYNTLAPEQIAYIAEHCEAKVAVVEGRDFADYGWVRSWEELLAGGRQALAAGRERFDAAWKQARPEDLATMLYTSGTTGPPKGVMTTHYNALWT